MQWATGDNSRGETRLSCSSGSIRGLRKVNDEEGVQEFYLFQLKKACDRDLVGLQICAQCCSLESHKILC